MNLTRYRFFLGLSTVLIVADLLLNTLVDVFKPDHVVQLVLYVVQDTCLLLDVIVIFLAFFSTYVFQAGLIWMLISRFFTVIVISSVYVGLSVALHVTKLTLGWENQYKYIWTPWFLALFVIHRTVAIFFYYFYKHTILLIADPKFHQRSKWIQLELSKKI